MDTGRTGSRTERIRARRGSGSIDSILVTLFCCLPFGIVGIIKASQVESQFRVGNYTGAQQSSADAGKWTKIGFFAGLGIGLLYTLLMIVGVVGNI